PARIRRATSTGKELEELELWIAERMQRDEDARADERDGPRSLGQLGHGLQPRGRRRRGQQREQCEDRRRHASPGGARVSTAASPLRATSRQLHLEGEVNVSEVRHV